MMNLGHRVADGTQPVNVFDIVMHQLKYPFTLLIPLILTILSVVTITQYLGQSWDIGTFSTPVLPTVTTFAEDFLNLDATVLLSDLVLVGYAFGPLALYALVYFLTGRHLPALFAGLLITLPRFPFAAIASERLVLAIAANDGAHIIGLTTIPLAGLGFFFFCKTGKKKYLALFVLLSILTALLSIFALMVLAILMTAISISEALLSEGKQKFLRLLVGFCGLGAVSLIVYNVSLLQMLISDQGQATLAVLSNMIPLSFFLIPVLGTFAFLIFDRRPLLQPLFISLSLTMTFGLLHMVRVSIVDLPILEQDRYAAELSFFTSFFVGLILMWIFDALRSGQLFKRSPALFENRTIIAFGFMSFVIASLIFSILFIPREII